MFQDDVPSHVPGHVPGEFQRLTSEFLPISYHTTVRTLQVHRESVLEYSTLVEIVAATHLSRFVQSPFPQRGGLMLVAPPGALKTTITETMDEFPGTQVISDMNVQTLVKMKDSFLSNHITTLAFTDFGKLYKRHGSVASNMEGIIMALAEEGFRKASFQSQTSGAMPARCTIIAGMTSSFYESKESEWEESGFKRRFLFAKYVISGMDVIEDAIYQWRRAELDGSFSAKMPVTRSINYKLDDKELDLVRHSVRHQYNRQASAVMLQKIFCVLKWKFKHDLERPSKIIRDFAPCLSKDGGTLILKETDTHKKK